MPQRFGSDLLYAKWRRQVRQAMLAASMCGFIAGAMIILSIDQHEQLKKARKALEERDVVITLEDRFGCAPDYRQWDPAPQKQQ